MSICTLAVAPIRWDGLEDIDAVEPLNEKDVDCLVELREVLSKHGKIDRLGVALLHSHFVLAEDELLLELSNNQDRILTLQPILHSEAEHAVGTIWKLGDGDFNIATVMPIQWGDIRDVADVEPLGHGDADCLVELREVLSKHGKIDRLGVALLHSHFVLAEDELLVETSDSEARTLILQPVKRSDVGDTVGTVWKLTDGDFLAMAHCHRYCKRDWLTKGHNKAHTSKR